MRGLKYADKELSCYESLSHSTRVRGLKLLDIGRRYLGILVALYTSAWIEIGFTAKAVMQYTGRTLHECVD